MSEAVLYVRLRNAPAALERLVGLLRRRAFVLSRITASVEKGGTLEVTLGFDDAQNDARRIRTEVESLVDVLELRHEGRSEPNQAGTHP